MFSVSTAHLRPQVIAFCAFALDHTKLESEGTVLAFLCLGKPLSYNARLKDAYHANLRASCAAAQTAAPFEAQTLYGVVYYLKNTAYTLDADNLSKPVWDALTGIAYLDDSEILLRHAGIVDMRDTAVDTFDLSRLPDAVANQMIESVGTEDHVIYVELGPLEDTMYRFGLSGNGGVA